MLTTAIILFIVSIVAWMLGLGRVAKVSAAIAMALFSIAALLLILAIFLIVALVLR